ncbi:hypothetical protein D3H55_02770 [Bacillus salacetis]|uniref:Uncharacterized protein n=1 Tax=Bacillus salacetis TaxID=2315464 RepID=A0A3A1R644_9BACI|nr:hypothetical protein D3H55_02770 [Bacillus salacetis]
MQKQIWLKHKRFLRRILLKRREWRLIVPYTFSIQAPDFTINQGYWVWGQSRAFPKTENIFACKSGSNGKANSNGFMTIAHPMLSRR